MARAGRKDRGLLIKPDTTGKPMWYVRLWHEGKLGPTYAPWARLALLTGMRQAEQFGMTWQDVDLDRGVVTLPQTKAGVVQYVHLNEEAKTILRGMQAVAEAEAIAD